MDEYQGESVLTEDNIILFLIEVAAFCGLNLKIKARIFQPLLY